MNGTPKARPPSVSDFDLTTGLTEGMAAYRRELNGEFFSRPPGEALSAGAGLEFFSLPAHLALAAPPYVALGGYLQRGGSIPRRLLDLGCGCGRGTCYLKRHSPPGTSVAGLDPVRALVASAAERCRSPSPVFLAGTAVALPFPAGIFDLVSSVFSLIHHLPLPELETAFREAARVLKPGGIFVFTTPNRALSQELYHPNRDDDPALRFSRLNRHEFKPEELRSFLDDMVGGPDRIFTGYALFGLFNPIFQPVWEKTIREMGRKRFAGNRFAAGAASMVRYFLTPNSRTRYFLNRLNRNTARMRVAPEDIAAAAVFRPVGDGADALHLLAVMRKGV